MFDASAPRWNSGVRKAIVFFLHHAAKCQACRIASGAQGNGGATIIVNRFYIEWSNRNGGAIKAVQNIGRKASICQGRKNHRHAGSREGCDADVNIATDVISMQTVLLTAVGDAD